MGLWGDGKMGTKERGTWAVGKWNPNSPIPHHPIPLHFTTTTFPGRNQAVDGFTSPSWATILGLRS